MLLVRLFDGAVLVQLIEDFSSDPCWSDRQMVLGIETRRRAVAPFAVGEIVAWQSHMQGTRSVDKRLKKVAEPVVTNSARCSRSSGYVSFFV